MTLLFLPHFSCCKSSFITLKCICRCSCQSALYSLSVPSLCICCQLLKLLVHGDCQSEAVEYLEGVSRMSHSGIKLRCMNISKEIFSATTCLPLYRFMQLLQLFNISSVMHTLTQVEDK